MKHAGVECNCSSKMKKSSFLKGQNFINYVFDPPSLKSIALVAVAVKLYGCPNEEESEIHYNSDGKNSCPIGGEQAALQKLEEIGLPHSLKRQVSNVIRPVELQWKGWVDYAEGEDYEKYCDLKKLYEKKGSSYWTMEGIIDVVKLLKYIFDTVKEMNSQKVDFTTLYESACMYCMEEYISEFWLKIPKKKKQAKYYARTRCYHLHIVAYWTASMNNELPCLIDKLAENDRADLYDMDLSIYENMISAFIASGNLIALKYFWNYKLTEEEKESNLENWILLVMKTMKEEYFKSYEENFNLRYDDEDVDQYGAYYNLFHGYSTEYSYQDYTAHTYIMCFLLSHLSSQSEQKKVFQAHSKVILLSLFSHWPLQRFFMPTITAMLDFLDENIYVEIMSKIGHSVMSRRTEVLLREIWDISPLNLKKAFIHYSKYEAETIVQLLFVGVDATIDMILNYATAQEKKQIFFCILSESEFCRFLYFNLNSDKMAVSAIDKLASKTLTGSDLHTYKKVVMLNLATVLSCEWICAGNFESLSTLWNWAAPSKVETRLFKEEYINLEDIYMSLLISGDYGRVNDFLIWYFETEEEISEFKKSFICKDNLGKCKLMVEYLSWKGRDGWESFEKFQNFSLNSSDELLEIKKAFAELVEQGEFYSSYSGEFNSLFKDWCLSTASGKVFPSEEKFRVPI